MSESEFDQLDCEIVSLELLPTHLDFETFISRDLDYTTNFFHKCAKVHHKELTHKVYVYYLEQEEEILGFTSIHVKSAWGTLNIEVNGEKKKERIHFPFLDIAFLSVAEKYDEYKENCTEIIERFLEKIDEIAFNISKDAGCRFIRSSVVYQYKKNISHNDIFEEPAITPWIEDILKERQFVDLTESEEYDIQLDKPTRGPSKDDPKVVLKYLIRNLKIEEDSE